MQAQIEELLSADAPTLARMEDTLTEGYAKALALEAERWRLERRIGEVAREGSTDVGEELRSLWVRSSRTPTASSQSSAACSAPCTSEHVSLASAASRS